MPRPPSSPVSEPPYNPFLIGYYTPHKRDFGHQLQLIKVLVLKLVHFHVHMLVSSYEQKVPIACFKLKFR